MRKFILAGLLFLGSVQLGWAQSLEKMQWFNEPEQWEIKDNTLVIQWTMLLSIMPLMEESLK